MKLDNVKRWVPPVVRGMTSDGETGLVVSVVDASGPALTFPHPIDKQSIDETVHAWRQLFNEYCTKNNSYPASVGIAGLDWALGLGVTFEEAQVAQGVSRNPLEKRVITRANIMQNKISLVTGGAQGFGEGIVKGLVAEGGFVYIADLNRAGAEALALQLNEEAGRQVASALFVDVTNEASVEAMLDKIALQSGSLDLFVSNAGVLKAGSVKEMALKDFQFVTDVDYTGFFICTKFAGRQLALQNMGSGGKYLTDIVTISSKSGLEGSNKNGAYAGAKFGTIGLTQSFALELVTDNIKVNAVCPGNFLDGPLWSDPDRGLFVQYLATGKVPGAKTIEDVRRAYEAKVPLNRGCRTEDVVRALCYIVEQKYETGQAVPVTGGQVMLN